MMHDVCNYTMDGKSCRATGLAGLGLQLGGCRAGPSPPQKHLLPMSGSRAEQGVPTTLSQPPCQLQAQGNWSEPWHLEVLAEYFRTSSLCSPHALQFCCGGVAWQGSLLGLIPLIICSCY